MAAEPMGGKSKPSQKGSRYRSDQGHGDVSCNSRLSKRAIKWEKKANERRAMKLAIEWCETNKRGAKACVSHFRILNNPLSPGYDPNHEDLKKYGIGIPSSKRWTLQRHLKRRRLEKEEGAAIVKPLDEPQWKSVHYEMVCYSLSDTHGGSC
jgi:hypothetical protein